MNKENITDKIEDYMVSEIGEFFEFAGSKNITGRIYGLLMSHNEPMSLKEISEKLHLSKSSVSTNIRIGVQMELFKKVYVKGQPREDFYEVANDFVDLVTRPGIKKLELLTAKINGARDILEQSASEIKNDDKLKALYKKIMYLDRSFEVFNEEYKKFAERVEARTNLLKEEI